MIYRGWNPMGPLGFGAGTGGFSIFRMASKTIIIKQICWLYRKGEESDL